MAALVALAVGSLEGIAHKEAAVVVAAPRALVALVALARLRPARLERSTWAAMPPSRRAMGLAEGGADILAAAPAAVSLTTTAAVAAARAFQGPIAP